MTLIPPSTLLMGPAGTGKTTSIVTALAAGLEVRMLATEPTAPSRILEELKKRNLAARIPYFDWSYVSPSSPKWDSLIESANIIGAMTLKDIANLSQGIAKPDNKQWIKLLMGIQNWKSSKNGTEYGDATEWSNDIMFVIDGLTGINFMSRALTVGLKPNPSPGEWGVMQNNILDLVRKLATDCRCFFTLIAHVERETNDLTGIANVTVSTLGAKLAPKIPPWFTNVVLTKKVADKFFWSTSEMGVDTKNGDLPIDANLSPDFKPIIDGYRARSAAAATASPGTVATPTATTALIPVGTK